MKRSLTLILSSIILIYFTILIYLSYNKIELNNTFDAIAELMTVPLISLTTFLLIFNLNNWYQEKFSLKSTSILPFLILLAAIILMVLATLYDI